MSQAENMVYVQRGLLTESIHTGHMAAVDYRGDLIASVGNPQFVTFARSTAKLLQAIPLLETGAASSLGLNQADIAVTCASHSGEAAHTKQVQSLLSKAGLSSSLLQCGIHPPFDQLSAEKVRQSGEDFTAVHNNCSGKHGGMLVLAHYLHASLENYMDPNHPVQKAMLKVISEMTEMPIEDIHLGTDGCGVPVFGLPIAKLALGYSKLGHGESMSAQRSEACTTIISALRKHPYLLAGRNRFDTRLIEVTGGRIIGKMGAEGVFTLAIPEEKTAMVIKIQDGSERALYPAVVEALSQMNMLTADELQELRTFHHPITRNWKGDQVGSLLPAFQVK